MFPFPGTEPEVRIVDLPNEQFEVVCRDAQSGFVLLELGAENEFSFYDYPKDGGRLALSGAHRLSVTERVIVDEFEMLVIKSHYAEAGGAYAGPPAYWNHVVRASDVESAEIESATGAKWVYRAHPAMAKPTVLRPGLVLEGTEPLFTSGQETEKTVDVFLEVVGAAEVSIGPKDYRCLRVHWSTPTPEQNVLAEYYVADTGRTVFFRRYDGPESPRYEGLDGHLSLEYRGVVWRHFYDCIPDHALITGAY